MIRYPITEAQLRAAITKKNKNWLDQAAQKTAEFRRLGKYQEKSPSWSIVKSVYMTLQGRSKCAFCERKLESVELGAMEQDIEHFRPKGNVKEWKLSADLTAAGVKCTPVPGEKRGYYLLPYHIFNYSAACKPCNSALKSDRFPIAGKYRLTGANPAKMKSERPLLIYPIGSIDDDPEKLIAFHGASPHAVVARGYRRHRALVTIEFFKLDDLTKRKNLLRERIFMIVALYAQLTIANDRTAGAAARARAKKAVEIATRSTSSHANCARSFTRLFKRSRAEAAAVEAAAFRLMETIS